MRKLIIIFGVFLLCCISGCSPKQENKKVSSKKQTEVTKQTQAEKTPETKSQTFSQITNDSPHFGLWAVIGLEFIMILALGGLYFVTFRGKVVAIVTDSKRVKSFIKQQMPQQNENGNQQNIIKSSLGEKEIDTISDIVVPRVLECVKLELQDTSKPLNKQNNAENSNPDIKFFRSKQGKILQEEVSNNSEAAFKVFNIKGNEAKFEYCGGVVNSDFFDGICIFENNPADVPNKTAIKTTVSGVVKKDINGNWEVTTPAKIKFV